MTSERSHVHDHRAHDGHAHAGHAHGHSHAPADFSRAFAIGVALNLGFVVAEVAFGLAADSLALLADAAQVAMWKGLAAGATNLALALALGSRLPAPPVVALAGLLGFVSYGASLVLFVRALRDLGTARTGAYFSTAPFAGAIISVLWLGEPVTAALAAAAALMAAGVWLHLTEHHEHRHLHEPIEHEHEHAHDAHHLHAHDEPVAPGVRHTHRHRHEALAHSHEHFPDAHHRHPHH
ncbi:MAG TPA: DMT family transporter [Usitatibacter sp.]